MAAEFIEHLTLEGERWDQLAARYYGDAHAFGRILVANAHVPARVVLAGGVRLRIPVVERAVAAPDQELPPWL